MWGTAAGIAPRLIHSTTPSRSASSSELVAELLPLVVGLRTDQHEDVAVAERTCRSRCPATACVRARRPPRRGPAAALGSRSASRRRTRRRLGRPPPRGSRTRSPRPPRRSTRRTPRAGRAPRAWGSGPGVGRASHFEHRPEAKEPPGGVSTYQGRERADRGTQTTLRFLAVPLLAGVLTACSRRRDRRVPVATRAGDHGVPDAGARRRDPRRDRRGRQPVLSRRGGGAHLGHGLRRQRAARDRSGDERGGPTYRMPGGPCGMVERDGTLWVETQNGLVVFDPQRGEVIDRLPIDGGVFGVTSTRSGLWGVAGQAEQVVQIDPDSQAVVAGSTWRVRSAVSPWTATGSGSLPGARSSGSIPTAIDRRHDRPRLLRAGGDRGRRGPPLGLELLRGERPACRCPHGEGARSSARGRRPVRRHRDRRLVLGVGEQRHDLPAGRRERRSRRSSSSSSASARSPRRATCGPWTSSPTPSSGSTRARLLEGHPAVVHFDSGLGFRPMSAARSGDSLDPR